MIGLDEYTAMFQATKIQYFDTTKCFAYAPFTNRAEQIDLGVMERKAKVIIFDTRTSYINATQLVNEFKDSDYRRFVDFSKTKHFQDSLKLIEEELNSHPPTDQKYYKLPCYSASDKIFVGSYSIRQSSRTDGFAGTYVHPDMIIHVLLWCNFKLAAKVSKFITTLFLREGANESVTISNEIKDEMTDLYADLDEKNKIIEKINAENRYLSDYVDSVKFDIVQYHKSLSYIADLREENKLLRKALAAVPNSNYQMILVVRHYDPDGKFSYGAKGYKLSLVLINANDLERYLLKYNKTEPQTEEDVEKNIIKYSSEVIYRIPSLKDVSPDFDAVFISIYEDQIDMWVEKTKTKEYICTTDIDAFTAALSEFCADWQSV